MLQEYEQLREKGGEGDEGGGEIDWGVEGGWMFQNGNDKRNKMNLESEIKDCWID